MPRKTYRPEEIIAKLRQADVLLGEGEKMPEIMAIVVDGVTMEWLALRDDERARRHIELLGDYLLGSAAEDPTHRDGRGRRRLRHDRSAMECVIWSIVLDS